MKLIQSSSQGSNNLLSSQLPSKLLTFPLANNSSWVPVSTHSPALNTTLAACEKYTTLTMHVDLYIHTCVYMPTYITYYIYMIFYLFLSAFWKRENFQSAMSDYQVDLHLFNICYFRSIPERQPRNRNHKTHESVEQRSKWSFAKKAVLNFSSKCASRGSRFQVQWVLTLVTCNHGTIRSASFTVDKRCAITLELVMKWHGVDIYKKTTDLLRKVLKRKLPLLGIWTFPFKRHNSKFLMLFN